MGHVINPINFRLGYSRYWNSVWSLSNLSNYAQLTNLDSIVLKLTLQYFKKLFFSKAFRFIILLNNCRIIRKHNSTQVIMHLYDAIAEQSKTSIMLKLKRSFLRWRIFQSSRWKNANWIMLTSRKLRKARRRVISMLHLTTNVLRRNFLTSRFAPKAFMLDSKSFNYKRFSLSISRITFYPVNLRSFYQYIKNLYFLLKALTTKSKKLRPVLKPKFSKSRKFFPRYNILLRRNKRRVNVSAVHFLFSRYFIYRFRKLLSDFWWQMKYNLTYILRPFIPNLLPSNITIVGLNDFTVDAKFITTFISYHLSHRYYLFQILKVLWRVLNRFIRKRILYGYQVKLSGRFRKNEKAVYLTRKLGSIGRYDIKRYVDYSFATARMRLGVTGIKVWMSYSSNLDMLAKTKINNLSNVIDARWLDPTLSKSKLFSIPIRVLRSSVLKRRCSWSSALNKFSYKSFILSNQINIRKSRFLLARYSYIY